MTRQQKLTWGFFAGLLLLGYFVFRSPSSHQDLSSQNPPEPTAPANSQNQVAAKNEVAQSRSMQRAAASAEAVEENTMEAASRRAVKMAQHDLSPIKRDISVGELRDSQIVQGSWKLVTSVFAVPRALVSDEDRSLALGELSGYSLFEAGRNGVQEDPFASEKPLIVFDTRTQSFGVLTGTIVIYLRSGSSMEGLAQDHRLRVQNAFPETGTYYVTSQDQPFNLSQFKSALERDSRINKVEVEIVSHQYGKQ